MAPAFGFPSRWAEKLGPQKLNAWRTEGSLEVENYATGGLERVGYQLYEDAQWHDDFPDVGQPTLLFHGRFDETVDPLVSVDFARGRDNVRLELLDSDHALTDQMELMWMQMARFYRELRHRQ
jgi:pimeloyl-ACP methyl ester carboxylesterase